MIRHWMFALILLAVLSPSVSAQFTAFDNTNDGGNTLASGTGVLFLNDPLRQMAIIFSTPTTTDVRLTELRMGFQLISGTSPFDLKVELKSVDETNSDVPTGPTLASFTTTQAVAGTPAYSSYSLAGSNFDSYDLTANTKYALLASQTGGADQVRWVVPTSNPAYNSSTDFTFVRMWFTNDAGAVWQSSTTHPSMQVSFTPVPEPATVGLMGAAGLAIVGWIRRRASGSPVA